jgi:hypothetical protein
VRWTRPISIEGIQYQAITTHDGSSTRWVATHSSSPATVGRLFDHDFVAEFPVTGSVPGTPAADKDGTSLLWEIRQAQPYVGESAEAYAARVRRFMANDPGGVS